MHREAGQGSLSVDLLHGKSTYSFGAVKSDESDYVANTFTVLVGELRISGVFGR